MRGIREMFRSTWRSIILPPFWKQIDSKLDPLHQAILWGWSIAGLILGAFIAPPLAHTWNIANGTAVIGPLSVQFAFGVGVALSVSALVQSIGGTLSFTLAGFQALLPTILSVLLPLTALGYALHGYI